MVQVPAQHLKGRLRLGRQFFPGAAQKAPLVVKSRQLVVIRLPQQRGLLLAGVDVIGDCITEINVTSPTCFQEIFDQTGCDVAALFVDALEAAVAQAS